MSNASIQAGAEALHEAARRLFFDQLMALPAGERARLENMAGKGKFRIDVCLSASTAAVDVVFDPTEGPRQLVSHLELPLAPHEAGCGCVACEP